MKRRTMLLGLGTAVGGMAVGTGAFTSVEAQRDLTVEVAGDADAFLRIAPTEEPNGEYAEIDDGLFGLDFTDGNDRIAGGGEGFNPESVTAIRDVFLVQNQGTQTIDLSLDYGMGDDTGSASIVLQPDVGDAALLILLPTGEPVDESVELGPGDEQTFSVVAAVSESISAIPAIERDDVVFTAEA